MRLKGLILTDEKGNKYQFLRIAPKAKADSKKLDISKWLKSERQKAGLTQEQLEEKTGILQPNLSAYEKGTRMPREASLKKLRAAFSKSP